MKIVTVIGARPQFIKCAPVSAALRRQHREVLVHTGQHYDNNMSQVFFDELEIPTPDVSLGIGGGSHAEQTGQMLIGIEKILLKEKPDWCLVYGDTNSTLAGALAAAKLQVPVAHVEAGLRSFNREMPEEINRVLTDHAADILFCPTEEASRQLRSEGISSGVHVVGDVMLDVQERLLPKARANSHILETLGVEPQDYLLATIHRAGNTDNIGNLRLLLDTLGRIDRRVVFPMHPRTRRAVAEHSLPIPAGVRVIDPLGYLDILQLEANADAILTDSGGMQKEAYWLGVRCITLRAETEWTETVMTGWNRLVGNDPEKILDAVQNWYPQGIRPDIYGNGNAAIKINEILSG